MKLSIIPGSENYACTIIKLPVKRKVEGLDNLVRVEVFGNSCLVGKDSLEDQLYLFFPAETQLSHVFLLHNDLYRDVTKNLDNTKKGFFEDSGRVKSLKFKGIISTGFVIPVSSLYFLDNTNAIRNLKQGDEFTNIDGFQICKKYKVERQQSEKQTIESRFNKKLKRFDKLVPNQFRFHESTAHLAKNLHLFKYDDIIVISDKWHGTSAVFSNVLVNKELTWKEKIAKKLGIKVQDKVYDNLYSSRSVLKNQYINKEQNGGFYNEDIWGTVNKELEGKIDQGITIYGEIVGFLKSGGFIQKRYDYSCNEGEYKFLVYRITYTKPDGSYIEFSWQQIKDYCDKYSLETVKELYFGKVSGYISGFEAYETVQDDLLDTLTREYLEKKCQHCKNDVPAEGVVVRLDGKQTFSVYKLKSKSFLEQETKDLDKGEINIEDEQILA